MIQTKPKSCSRCHQVKTIWKAHGREKYCRDCWYQMEKPKPIKARSVSMVKTMSEYEKKRIAYLALHPFCQLRLPICTGKATDIHHSEGRGENHNNLSTFRAACKPCHDWAEKNPEEAKVLGFSNSRLNKKDNG